MIGTVLIPNVIAMTLLLVLLAGTNTVAQYGLLLDSKIFIAMVVCNFLQCIGEITASAIDGVMLPGLHSFNVTVNTLLFIVNITFAYLWVIYADYKIFEDVERIKKHSRILALPALIIILGCVVNIFIPVFFEVTPDNCYQRTNLYPIPYLVTYFYLVYGTVFIYRYRNQARKYVFLPAMVFMFPIFLGSSVQYLYYGVSTTWAGVAIALTAVYVNVQNEVSYTDSLSGLYTRIYMYRYLENSFRINDHQTKIAGIMLDIDAFKKINDTYGHLTGDDAIRSAGKLLRNLGIKGCIAARYGGDEFVVLQKVSKDEDILKTMEQITKAEEEFNLAGEKVYELHFSQGCSILDLEKDSIDSFLERMDHAMYEVKKARKNSEAR